MKRLFLHLILILGMGLVYSVSSYSNEDIKKINDQLKSLEDAYKLGALDEEAYNNSKLRLIKKKKSIKI